MKSNQWVLVPLCSVPQTESELRAETKMTVSGPSLLWHTQMLWMPSWPLRRPRTWLWTWGSNLSPARCPPRPTAPLCHPQLLRSHLGSLHSSTAFNFVWEFCSFLIRKLCMWAPEKFICFNKLHAKEWSIKLKRYRGIFYLPKHNDFASGDTDFSHHCPHTTGEAGGGGSDLYQGGAWGGGGDGHLAAGLQGGAGSSSGTGGQAYGESWFVSEMISADVWASSQINACFCLMLQAQGSATEPAGPPANLSNPIPSFSSAGPNTCE